VLAVQTAIADPDRLVEASEREKLDKQRARLVETQRQSATTCRELQPSNRADNREIGIDKPGHVDARAISAPIGTGFV
jgi:hypothetical protein